MSVADALGALAAEPGEATDIAGHALGEAVAWTRPHDGAEVSAIVKVAREHATPIAVAGARTAYWRPLSFDGAIVLDVRGLDGVGAVRDGVIEVGGGAALRAVEGALSSAGAELIAHPDAYGESTVGAMVATAFASGVGVGRATVAELVTGLEVVLGTGETIRTGASRVLGGPGFTRLGLPDPTALFFGSEGALGIVTGLTLRAEPARPRLALEWRPEGDGPAMRAALALARDLRAGGAWDTLRIELVAEGGPPAARATLILSAPFGEDELALRAKKARAMIERAFGGVAIEERPDPPRWWGAPEEHRASIGDGVFRGVDVIVAYAEAGALIEAAGALYLPAARAPALRSLRGALYFAPGWVNLGLHGVWTEEGEAERFVAEGMTRFARLHAVPYRWGRDWGPLLSEKLDPGYLALMRDLKRRCDPDGVLCPGASVVP